MTQRLTRSLGFLRCMGVVALVAAVGHGSLYGAPDEVPRIQAQALRAAGVEDSAISIIPDEQEAIEAALRMGEAGDLLLIFADALARSWKQITKFKSSGGPAPSPTAAHSLSGNGASEGVLEDLGAAAPAAVPDFNLEGLIRDERGIRMAPESSD